MKKLLIALPITLLLVKVVQAHCPLCTVGAAAAAGGAAWLGVSEIVIGLFMGAFAVSIGWWMSRVIKRQLIPFQRPAIILFSFATTIIPLLSILGGIHPVYVSIGGDYGSWLNRTYLLNLFLIGSIIGGFVVTITPWLSSRITKIRSGKMIPYQGITLTFALLLIVAVVMQFAI